jgi:hypothetical protein
MPAQTSPFRGFKAMGVFLYFGAVMASLAGVTLVWHGTFLDRLWILKPRAYNQLSPSGTAAGIAFLLLGATLALAGSGWLRRRFWGWALAVVILATQVIANLVDAARGDFLRGGVGFLLSGALLCFLLCPKVRVVFTRESSGSTN